ncbi:MAG TPA: bifunctional ADP-heptose synthase [Pyrinomonadaceae bacterium]|nr:bifunctional ADP-heptose synthase [Pyrinomonadaceae bacterium]
MSNERTILQERLLSIVRRFPQRKLVVVGDAIADRFLYGSIARVSREAPVFILRHEQTQTIPGGAGNCAVNLAALGAHVSLIAAAGDDEAGRELRNKLESAHVDSEGLITSSELKTTTKVRILAGQVHSTRQQVIRIDYEDAPLSDGNVRRSLNSALDKAASDADAVIISDYNYGVVDESVLETLRQVAGKRRIPILVDSRFRLASLNGFTSATPNEDEVEYLLGEKIENASQLEKASEELRQKLDYKALLVTRGSQGMMLLEGGVAPLHIKAVGAESPVDVTGAGDTVIATFALALSCDSSFSDAARLANYAGGLVVMKRGTASITSAELEHSIINSET